MRPATIAPPSCTPIVCCACRSLTIPVRGHTTGALRLAVRQRNQWHSHSRLRIQPAAPRSGSDHGSAYLGVGPRLELGNGPCSFDRSSFILTTVRVSIGVSLVTENMLVLGRIIAFTVLMYTTLSCCHGLRNRHGSVDDRGTLHQGRAALTVSHRLKNRPAVSVSPPAPSPPPTSAPRRTGSGCRPWSPGCRPRSALRCPCPPGKRPARS